LATATRKGDKEPFTAADLPRIQSLFDVFDEDKDGSVEPKEIWTAHQAMSGDDVTKKAFMMRMDSGMRTFCGVPQLKAVAVPVSRRGRGKGGKSSRKGRGNGRGKANKRGKGGKGKGRKNGMKATKKMFMQFARADADFDMKVSPMEMGTLMNKMSKRMCMKYKKEQVKNRTKSWMKEGVPAEVQAEMEAKKAEMKEKWGAKRAEMMQKWEAMKRGGRRNGGRNGRNNNRRGDKGRGRN